MGGAVEDQIDLQGDREEVLFQLAGLVPVTLEELAAVCVRDRTEVELQLNQRFAREVSVDGDENTVTLTDAARNAVTGQCSSLLETAKQDLRQGEALLAEDEPATALSHFQAAVATLERIRDRFDAVDYQSETLAEVITDINQTLADTHHTIATEEVATDTTQAEDLRAAAEEALESGRRETGIERLKAAHQALKSALGRAEEHNDSRQQGSPDMDTEEVLTRLAAVEEAIQELSDDTKSQPGPATQEDSPEESGDSSTAAEVTGASEADSLHEVSTGKYSGLTDFQRDILVVVAGLDTPKGTEVMSELSEYYGEDINHGRLYPNLDTLAEEGFIDKTAINERSNGYLLTDYGRAHLLRRRQWEDRQLEAASETIQSSDAPTETGAASSETTVEKAPTERSNPDESSEQAGAGDGASTATEDADSAGILDEINREFTATGDEDAGDDQ